MKMAALQLMQQKANKERKLATLTENSSPGAAVPALPSTETPDGSAESSETSTETLTDANSDAAQTETTSTSDAPQAAATETTTTEAAPKTEPMTETDSSATTTTNASQATPIEVNVVPMVTTNGPLVPFATAIQNGECESPLEGKAEAEDSIPGLAQAKELAESLAAEDGSGIGTSKPLQGRERLGKSSRWRNAFKEEVSLFAP